MIKIVLKYAVVNGIVSLIGRHSAITFITLEIIKKGFVKYQELLVSCSVVLPNYLVA